MVTGLREATLVSLGESVASDPKLMTANFWNQLSEGNDRRVAQEIGRLIWPPVMFAFLFEDVDGEGGDQGKLTVAVVADTPSTVMDS